MISRKHTTWLSLLIAALVFSGIGASGAMAQQRGLKHPPHPPPPGERGSANITVRSHIPLGAGGTISDVEVEQELSRPYAYVARRVQEIGFDVISLEDPDHAKVIQRWRIENPELHQGGAMDGRYFKHEGRYYYVQSTQFRQGGPNSNVGAIIFDVTDLPETIQEVGRIRQSETRGGFHNIFVYKHSTGTPLLFATSGRFAKVFDLDKFLKGYQTEMDAVLTRGFWALAAYNYRKAAERWADGQKRQTAAYLNATATFIDESIGYYSGGLEVQSETLVQEMRELARELTARAALNGNAVTAQMEDFGQKVEQYSRQVRQAIEENVEAV